MDLVGILETRNEKYIVGLRDNKTSSTWLLYNTIHEDDRRNVVMGTPAVNPVLTMDNFRKLAKEGGYLAEALTRVKSTGKVSYYRNSFILSNVIMEFSKIQMFKFPEGTVAEDILDDSTEVLKHTFSAEFEDVAFIFHKEDGVFHRLAFRTNIMTLEFLKEQTLPVNLNQLSKEFVEIKKDKRVDLVNSMIKSMDYRTLRTFINLDWYESGGRKHKEYIPVHNKQEFEELVVNDMKNELTRCRLTGDEFILTFDTETTGLTFINISKDNPLLDSLVCISMSWRDDFAALIFVDMEYFENVEMTYALERLRPFLEKDHSDPLIKINTQHKVKAPISESTSINSFGTVTLSETESYQIQTIPFEFRRSEVTLVCHNGMFDGKVMYHYGVEIWFDVDTIQLAFNINPKLMKGNNKLENLLLREFGIEVPSLSLILGKNNEGAYRLIDDKEVALIYAGSDTDNLRPLFKRLRHLIGPKLYQRTLEQDIYHMNWLYVSEYKGMRVDSANFEAEGRKIKARMDYLTDWMKIYVGKIVHLKNAEKLVSIKMKQGASDEEARAYLKALMEEDPKPYDFKISGESLRQTLFEVLRYPKVKLTKPNKRYPQGQPAVDKDAIKKLKESKVPNTNLVKDDLYNPEEKDPITGKVPKDSILVKMEDLNTAEYPLAHILSVYGDMKKEYESYFAPILENNYEGIISRGFSLARIETRRIMNSLQTVKARLKKWILPNTEDHYMIVFDQAQVEPRIMVSVSGDEAEIKKFENPEVDYHTETASRIKGIEPHLLDKKTRKLYKEITLGLPYGLGLLKMCLKIFGKVTDTFKYETSVAIENWKRVNASVYKKLIEFRENGLKEVELSDEVRKFIGRDEEERNAKYGKSFNLVGFYRLFNLDNMDDVKRGKVMRPSGNFPIQSFAAELFRKILKNLREAMREEGILDKVIINMLIHDEAVSSVHKSVHPILMLKLIYENCIVTFKGHTKYFVGINVGDNWADGKDDEAECPVIFVNELRKRWDAGEFRDDDYWNWVYTFRNKEGKSVTYNGPKAYIYELKQKYLVKRIGQVVEQCYPQAKEGKIVLNDLLKVFKNYMVRAYVNDFFPPNSEVPDDNDDAMYSSRLESWAIDHYGEGYMFVDYQGKEKVLVRRDFNIKSTKIEVADLELDLDIVTDKEMFLEESDSYWNFDQVTVIDYTNEFLDDSMLSEDQWWDKYVDEEVDSFGHKVGKMKSFAKYEHMQEIAGQMVVRSKNVYIKNRLKTFLKPYVTDSKDGILIVFKDGAMERWMKVRKDFDFKMLDEEITNAYTATSK